MRGAILHGYPFWLLRGSDLVSTRLFSKRIGPGCTFFSRKPSNKWFSSNFDPYPAGLHPGFSNEAMWWSCPMALCGCTTSEAPDGSLMATKTSKNQGVQKWPEYAPVILQIIHSILLYIYMDISWYMIYQYMHIQFYLAFPLRRPWWFAQWGHPDADWPEMPRDGRWTPLEAPYEFGTTSQGGLNGRNLGKLATTWRTRGSRPTR